MILGVTYSGASNTSIGSLVVTTDSRVFTLTDDHTDFANILEMLKTGRNDEAEVALDRATAIRAAVTETKFSIVGNVVSYNGRDLPTVMADYIIRMKNEDFDLGPLEKFTDNLFQNPSFRALNEAFRFIQANQMPITEDGCFIGYRAVTPEYTDIRTQKFDNSIGAIVKEDRNLVDENPDRTCSNGLHVCSLEYINSGGYGRSDSPWIIVKVNPRDVVAVPRDYNNTKLRCCEFEVIGELDRSKISRGDKKSYREDKSVFEPNDQELIRARNFKALGTKHGKKAVGGTYSPSGVKNFTTAQSYADYIEAYNIAYGNSASHDRLAAATEWNKANPVVTAPKAAPGTHAFKARAMFNEGRYSDLMKFKKEKRVGFGRLGFTTTEEAVIERNRNVNNSPVPAVKKITDTLGYEVSEELVFDKHGYDQFGFRRSGYNRSGKTRGDVTKVLTVPKVTFTKDTTAGIPESNTMSRVAKVISEMLAVDNPDRHSSVVNDFGADSLDIVELIMAFEEEFGIEISDSEADDLINKDTISQITSAIERKLNPVVHTGPVTKAAVHAPTSGSQEYSKGYQDGSYATSFLPLHTGQEYWNGFCEAWKTNPNNTAK